MGGDARRPRARHRHGADRSHRVRCRSCPATTTAHGGCRTPPRPCRRGCSATSAASPSPIFAPRPAARPRNWRWPARRSPPSTARRRGSSGCGRILPRLQLSAEVVKADAAEWQGGPFDAVLVDAPCSSTGTIRRHPDIPWLKSEIDLKKLVALQTRLLDHAVDAAQARRHAGLLHLLAGSRGGRGSDRGAARPQSRPAPRPDPGRRGRRPCRTADARRRAAHPALLLGL